MTDVQVSAQIKNQLGEYLNNFVVVGFRGDNESPMIISQLNDAKSAIAINYLLAGIVGAGGLQTDAAQDEDR